jgi:hypothetical protein
MKIIWCFFTFSLFALSTTAQTNSYHPFPDSNATWRERTWFVDGLTLHEHKYQLFLSGDTAIGNHQYHKLYITSENTDYGYPQGGVLNYWFWGTSLYGFLRQDTDSKSVFFYDMLTQSDTLLYNFNLDVGDTIPGSFIHDPSTVITVTNIDSVFDGVGYKNKFLLGMYPAIIEGIGSESGLFDIPEALSPAGELNCFIHNDTILYTDGSFNACMLVDFTAEFLDKPVISTANSGSETVFSISRNHPGKFVLKIFNMSAQNIFSEHSAIGGTTIFHLPNLNDGIYFYSLQYESGQSYTGKFMKS